MPPWNVSAHWKKCTCPTFGQGVRRPHRAHSRRREHGAIGGGATISRRARQTCQLQHDLCLTCMAL
eukprot:7009640-Alexandrium_andersonii.AAC.1